MTTPIFSTRLPKDYHPVMRRLSLRLKSNPELLEQVITILDQIDNGSEDTGSTTNSTDIWRADLEHKVAGLMDVVAGLLKDVQSLKASSVRAPRLQEGGDDEARRLEAIAYQAICDAGGHIEGARELFLPYILRFPDLKKWVRDMKPSQLAGFLVSAHDRWQTIACR